MSVEQKPSEEVMRRVRPSLDLKMLAEALWHQYLKTYHARSVKVAQWRLLTTQRGVCCCVSYMRTESSVATAYTIRYGRENATVGPGDSAFVVTSRCLGLGDDSDADGSLACGTNGGGSMTEFDGSFVIAGSGRAAMGSSADDVSIVMCLVGGGAFLVL